MTRKEQKEARKIQIIQATLDLFVERGYYGTKTSQISRRAGISEGLLFHYFPTKEMLLEELVNIGLEGMRTPMQVKAENGLDFFYQFTKMLFLQTEKNPFIAKMFVFMGHIVRGEDVPEKLRKLAASVDTIAKPHDCILPKLGEGRAKRRKHSQRRCHVAVKYVLVCGTWNYGTVYFTSGYSFAGTGVDGGYAAK